MNDNSSPPPPYSAVSQPEKSAQISMADSQHFPPLPQAPSAPPNVYAPQMNNPSPAQQPPGAHPHPHVSANTGSFGPFPIEMDCPYCRNHIVTNCSMIAGTLPWIIMAICFVLGFFLVIPWCLCCVPFCVDSCLDVLHSCPSCKRTIGRFSRLG